MDTKLTKNVKGVYQVLAVGPCQDSLAVALLVDRPHGRGPLGAGACNKVADCLEKALDVIEGVVDVVKYPVILALELGSRLSELVFRVEIVIGVSAAIVDDELDAVDS